MNRGIHTNPDPDLDAMIQEVLDDVASAETRARLRERMERDVEVRARYAELEEVFARLDHLERVELPSSARPRSHARRAPRARRAVATSRTWFAGLTAVAAALVGILIWNGETADESLAPGSLLVGERFDTSVTETVGAVTVRMAARAEPSRVLVDARFTGTDGAPHRVELRVGDGRFVRADVPSAATAVIEGASLTLEFTASTEARIVVEDVLDLGPGLFVEIVVDHVHRAVPVPVDTTDFSTNPGTPDR